MGGRDIVEPRSAHGARTGLFAVAMFGELDAVTAILAADATARDFSRPGGILRRDRAESGGAATWHSL